MHRKGSHLAALVLLLAGTTALLAGCAKKSEQESMTTVDSTLAGSVSSDVPEPGPTPSQDYTPPASQTPPASKPRPHRPPSSSGGSSSGGTSSSSSASRSVTIPAGTSFD